MGFAAGAVVLEQEVDDARDRIRAVLRRGAVTQHLDLPQRNRENGRDVRSLRTVRHAGEPGDDTSGVIAWAPEDQPSDQDIDRVLDEFEQTAWAGLEPDRYAWAAVQHRVRTAEQNLSGFIPVNDAITTDSRQRHRRHQPDGRGVLVFVPPQGSWTVV